MFYNVCFQSMQGTGVNKHMLPALSGPKTQLSLEYYNTDIIKVLYNKPRLQKTIEPL